MTTDLPASVFDAIRRSATEEWPGNPEMQAHVIECEVDAYNALHALDYGAALQLKAALLQEASQFHDTWEDRVDFLRDEIRAVAELANLNPDDVPVALVRELKAKAEAEHDWYSTQLDEVQKGLAEYRYVQRTRAEIEPIRDLLVRMEKIIGSECYNANIQNYGAGGMWEGEGRSFRYPLTFTRDGEDEKRSSAPEDLAAEALITGRYKFGANELGIFRALVRIVDMLETDHGLQVKMKA